MNPAAETAEFDKWWQLHRELRWERYCAASIADRLQIMPDNYEEEHREEALASWLERAGRGAA